MSPCSRAIWLNSWTAGALWPTASFFGSELGTSIVAGRGISASDGKFNLNTAAIESLLIPLPPTLSEQREIVAVLDAMDLKIDLHLRRRVVLEELFKALLHKLIIGEIRVGELDPAQHFIPDLAGQPLH